MIVRTFPKDLSQGARDLYDIASHSSGCTIQRADDWQRSYRDKSGLPIKADQAFIPELVEAGLAKSRVSHFNGEDHVYLWVTPLHGAYAHASDGSDSKDYGYYAEVFVLSANGTREELLLTMMGATVRTDSTRGGQYPVPATSVIVRHSEETDDEHDSAYVADLTLVNPVVNNFSLVGAITLVGTLGEARYRPNSHPTTGDDSDTCDGKTCGRGKAHALVDYMPDRIAEQVALSGKMVKVTLTPRRMVDETGVFIELDESSEDDDS